MSETIITKIDAMGSRIDELEHAVADLMDQVRPSKLVCARLPCLVAFRLGAPLAFQPLVHPCLCRGLALWSSQAAADEEEEEASHQGSA